ncbi:uncharacterized protein LOC123350278 isoform X3 [Mauremys mutica]|uniref:uncharacterized protein LOC123350278 isoform X3 n=1 Tax=Mauremys mutica TaxID=74926 RepID=UPI001D16B291|nr:uncharacterized protein LOC123350278 isoform X3 [Mauremys mutica]
MHLGVKILSISSVPLLFVLKWFWGDFTVTVHVNPAVVLVGQAVTLSCHLIGQIPANIQVHWYKLERNKNTTLYFYNSTEKETELGLAEDQHRIKGRYRNGVARVKLFPVQVEDNGQYVCAVTSDGVYQEAIAQVTVPGFGSAPHVTIEHQQNNSTTLRCASQGWYPQPEVRWTDSTGQKITVMAETRIQKDVTELYQIHSTLRVADTATDTISCTIINPLLKRHRKTVIAISGFFDVEAEHVIITAVIGENAVLPCRLITKHLPPSMKLQWKKVGPGKNKTIYLYCYNESSPLVNAYPRDDKCSMGYLSPNGVNSREWLRKKYEKKAEVFKGKEFGKGNISLKLNNIQVEDEGKYVCSATANSFHREIIIEVLIRGAANRKFQEGVPQVKEKQIQDPWAQHKEENGDLEKRIRDLEKRIKELQEQKVALICLLLPSGVIVIFLGKCTRDLEKRIKELTEEKDKPWEDKCALICLLLCIADTIILFLGICKSNVFCLLLPNGVSVFLVLLKCKNKLWEDKCALICLLLCIAVTVIVFLGKCKNQQWENECYVICLFLPNGVTVIIVFGKWKKQLQEQMGELEKRIKEPQEQKEEPQEQKGELQKRIKELLEQMDEMKKELEWRRARNNSDDITLHGVTAHPNLSISGDKKSFTHEAQPQKVPSDPERFDSTVCVLGSEGFSSGKHYWEVEVVSSNDWDLGVARKSIQRKGKLTLSPREGFWALGLSGRDYWAKTDPWTLVVVQKKPKKIGVYLSYQEGRVTFFNVTDMSVLFTFNDCSFSGEVYPFFKNSHKETTIRLCSTKEE